ncbi:hypothetical protein [Embleya sp. NPDC005575]|uniref:hypothetical protein n=1 Tax=Embleya sp. NPDC005575 TaxID=3156892 RepID=UPI0033AABBC0
MTACSFDRAGGDRPPGFVGGVVAQLVELAGRVASADLDGLAQGCGQLLVFGLGEHVDGGAGGEGGVAGEDRGQVVGGSGFAPGFRAWR